MPFNETLENGVAGFFDGNYAISEGEVIPDVADIGLEGNVGREMDLAMLFIDMRRSTKLVDGFRRQTAAKMFKAFLWGSTRIIKENGGQVVSFNGDGILAAFSGDSKCSMAAKTALNLTWFGYEVMRPR